MKSKSPNDGLHYLFNESKLRSLCVSVVISYNNDEQRLQNKIMCFEKMVVRVKSLITQIYGTELGGIAGSLYYRMVYSLSYGWSGY